MTNTTMTQGSNRPTARRNARGRFCELPFTFVLSPERLQSPAFSAARSCPLRRSPTPTPVLDYYKQLSQDERRSIEYDLIWIGGTDAVTNGVVGRQSIAAIKEFERRIGTARGRHPAAPRAACAGPPGGACARGRGLRGRDR